MRLDAVLLLLFFVVMYDRLTQNPLHEALGTASLLIVCTHLLVNRTWLRQHFGAWFGMAVRRPRRPSVKNRISTISNVVLLATFAASFISGVMCSQTLFASVTPQVWRMDLSYRTVHVALSMWFFLAAAVHAGLHARFLLDKWESALKSRLPDWVAFLGKYGTLTILGVVAAQIWIRREFAFLLSFEMSYITVKRDELLIAMSFDLAVFSVPLSSLFMRPQKSSSPGADKNKKETYRFGTSPFPGIMVGAAGFELATPCTPCKCATRLRYVPTHKKILLDSVSNARESVANWFIINQLAIKRFSSVRTCSNRLSCGFWSFNRSPCRLYVW